MDSVKTQPDTLGVFFAMAGGLLVLYPIIPGLAIDHDQLLTKPLLLLAVLLAVVSIGKATRHFTSPGDRLTAIAGIVASWYLLYGTLLSHSLRF